MTAKDQKIIDAHAGAAPYDLLTQHGLSQKGYKELLEHEDARVANLLKPGKPKLVEQPIVQPVVTTLTLKSTTMLRNKVTGELVPMNATQAQKMANKYPKDFELA